MYQICMFFATTKKLSIIVESWHFRTFSAKHLKCKIVKKHGEGNFSNGHEKVMEKSWIFSFCRVCGKPEFYKADSSRSLQPNQGNLCIEYLLLQYGKGCLGY